VAAVTFESPTITVFFGLTGLGGTFFTLDDATKGKLDDATYKLAGDVGTDISGDAYGIDIVRGRSRDLDEFQAGTCTVRLRNHEGNYSALNEDSPYFGALLPGKRVTVGLYGQTLFDGVIESWSARERVGEDCEAEFTAKDALGQLARMEFAAWTGTAAQAPGARISAALNRGEVNFGANRDIGTGVATLQADTIDVGTNVLSYLQLVNASELGRFYASRNNVITFRDRHSVHPITEASVTFCDADYLNDGDPETLSRIPFNELGTTAGSDLLYTRVAVTREGGTTQTANDTTQQGVYGIRTLGVSGILVDSDSQSTDTAGFLLGAYKVPRERISSVTVYVSALEDIDKNPGLLGALDIGAIVTAEYTPCGSSTEVLQRLVVDGVEHAIDAEGGHWMTVRVSDDSEAASFLLDDDAFGILDTSRLGF
jgi:hypothetical protein